VPGWRAADPIAVMAEQCRPHRTCHEADGIDAEGLQRSDQTIGSWEEQAREDQGRNLNVEQEVVSLDDCADGAGDHGAAQLRAVLGIGETGSG
jgi:hypothetical protein